MTSVFIGHIRLIVFISFILNAFWGWGWAKKDTQNLYHFNLITKYDNVH